MTSLKDAVSAEAPVWRKWTRTRPATPRETPEEPDAVDAATSSEHRRRHPPKRLSSIWTSANVSRSTGVVVVVDVFAWVAVVAQFHKSYDDRDGSAAAVVVERDKVDDDDD